MKKHIDIIILAVGFAVVVGLWAGFAFVRLDHPVEKWGVFGDKFGALNCLFTGLALVGLVAGYWHERKQASARDSEQALLLQEMRRQAHATYYATKYHAKRFRLERVKDALTKAQWAANPAAEGNRLREEIAKLEGELDRFSDTDPAGSASA